MSGWDVALIGLGARLLEWLNDCLLGCLVDWVLVEWLKRLKGWLLVWFVIRFVCLFCCLVRCFVGVSLFHWPNG